MIHKKNTIYFLIFSIIFGVFLFLGNSFSFWQTNTTLGILPPPYQVVYTPAHSSGIYVSAPLYISITGDGIRINETGIRENGIYTINYYRGTGPFTTGAGYSSGNTRSLLSTTQIINWIDNISPSFVGVEEGEIYNIPVTIHFSDNFPGVTATLNGDPLSDGTIINTNGTYQIIVTDSAGNWTGATFTIYISSGHGGGGGAYTSYTDNCTLPSTLICANAQGIDYSDESNDHTCCLSLSEGPAIGARLLTKNICEERNCYSVYYDTLCGSCTPPTEPLLPLYRPPYHYTTPDSPSIQGSPYPSERNDAYKWAYELGLTSANTIQNADMEGILYRKIAAKMTSEFAMKAIGIIPDTSRLCEFDDIKNESKELQYYIKLSCQLGIMGLNYYGEPDTIFNPNHFVTRDQFVTILSRMIFRDNYNLKHGEYIFFDKVKNLAVHTLQNISHALNLPIAINTPLDWYTKHLEGIRKIGIMTNYDLTIKELRGYFILIVYRIDQIGVEKVEALIK